MASSKGFLYVLGLGYDFFTQEQLALLQQADVLCASQGLLSLAQKYLEPQKQSLIILPLALPLDRLFNQLNAFRQNGKKVVVLADGDPLFFGIGASLVKYFGNNDIKILPNISILQKICARLALPWHDVINLSLHGRNNWQELNIAIGLAKPICILCDRKNNPAFIAKYLFERGVDWFEAHIFEDLDSPSERKDYLPLTKLASEKNNREFVSNCTLLLLPVLQKIKKPYLGLETERLQYTGQCLTKLPVRAAALSLLRIEPQHTVWDIGAGSGAVALEACVLAWRGQVIAIENNALRIDKIRENRRNFGATILEICHGHAPECLEALPQPDCVFIGGGLSGENARSILDCVCTRLAPGGRLVISCILFQTLFFCKQYFETLGWPLTITQIQDSESVALGNDKYLQAHNAIFLLATQK